MELTNIPVIEHSKIQELIVLGQQSQCDVLGELCTIFEKVAPDRLAKMQQALPTQNLELIKKEVHALKASSGNMGMARLFKLCVDLEEILARSNTSHESIEIAVVELNRELYEALTELKHVVSALRKQPA